jgi:heme O synthase-like polyprenyltransferase
MHAHPTHPTDWRHIASQYLALTKPRIVLLAAFCALIGMLLATEEWCRCGSFFGTLGIALLAAGFALQLPDRARHRREDGRHPPGRWPRRSQRPAP